jgi:hypothetical protein
MTKHAHLPDTATVSARIAQLSLLPMDSIWALWDELFNQRPNHHHRTWLESRLAYKLQERAFGGLKVSVRRKLESFGETGVLPKHLQRAADRLLPGTVLTRTYDDVDHYVLVRGLRDFEYRGQRFTSLTAIARVITGSPWSGPMFFGLKTRSKQEAS